jgi:hypothetical protein
MKLPSIPLIVALAPAILLVAGGCTKTDKDNAAAVVQDIKVTATDTWDSIKDFTFEKHDEFKASIDRMSKKLDNNVAELRAQAPAVAASDRDEALKEYDAARADLKARLTDLGNATADTWADAKVKVADAWQRMQAAYAKATK